MPGAHETADEGGAQHGESADDESFYEKQETLQDARLQQEGL
jgi:hypothetical protein